MVPKLRIGYKRYNFVLCRALELRRRAPKFPLGTNVAQLRTKWYVIDTKFALLETIIAFLGTKCVVGHQNCHVMHKTCLVVHRCCAI
jgi:hypothetical protein